MSVPERNMLFIFGGDTSLSKQDNVPDRYCDHFCSILLRVSDYETVNPGCSTLLIGGYQFGDKAPAIFPDVNCLYDVLHAYHAYRESAHQDTRFFAPKKSLDEFLPREIPHRELHLMILRKLLLLAEFITDSRKERLSVIINDFVKTLESLKDKTDILYGPEKVADMYDALQRRDPKKVVDLSILAHGLKYVDTNTTAIQMVYQHGINKAYSADDLLRACPHRLKGQKQLIYLESCFGGAFFGANPRSVRAKLSPDNRVFVCPVPATQEGLMGQERYAAIYNKAVTDLIYKFYDDDVSLLNGYFCLAEPDFTDHDGRRVEFESLERDSSLVSQLSWDGMDEDMSENDEEEEEQPKSDGITKTTGGN